MFRLPFAGVAPALLPLAAIALLGCAAPGLALHARADDFAFVEVRLRG